MTTPNADLSPILIVDDEKDNLEALRRLLRTQFDVTITVSPIEALKLVQQKTFSVIVSDQRMPEISGVELLEKIKVISPSSVRILLTGYTDLDSVIGAINRGNIYRYIAKPWDPEELKLTLRQADEAFRLRREVEIKNIELQKALEELRQLDRAKARFMSLISHELNTPLTVLMSFVGMLTEQKFALPPDLSKTVAALESASGRFSEIISEVLTFVRLESNPELHAQEMDVEGETRSQIKKFSPELERKKITVEINAAATAAKVDPEKFKVALHKLLEDAVLHSPEQSKIEISLSKQGNNFVYKLTRRGTVLSSKALEPFEPLGEAMHHQKDLGMRLAICRLVVEGHGGQVTVENAPPYSSVILTVPV
jgi:two-component system sensor histidine kinase/response regulator